MAKTVDKWICTVCGYVHNGPEPPDYCPICGSTSDLFEPHREAQIQPVKTKNGAWRCLNCEYIHDGDNPPDYCPVCGAAAERFESFTIETTTKLSSTGKQRIVVIGAGIAGDSAVESIKSTSPKSEIILVSKEDDLPYYRLNLTRYLAGEIKEDELFLHPADWYEEKGIQLVLNTELTSIEPDKNTIRLRDKDALPYDQLILTVGSHPFVPPFPGANRDNVVVLRTKKDANFILRQIEKSPKCVVIGGGLLGLETAGALARQGKDVSLLEGHAWLLPRQLNKKAAEILEKMIAGVGIHIKKNARTKEIVGDEAVKGVMLEDETLIPADLVIITTGVRSNSYIARMAGLDVHDGIVVNNFLRTSVANIYAAGDAAEHQGVFYGTWGPSLFQGRIAGINAAGGEAEFAGIPRSNMLKVLGIDLFSLGQILTPDASYQSIDGKIGENYHYFVFRDSQMEGFILLGDTNLSGQAKHVVERGIDCSQLLMEGVDVSGVLSFISSHAE